ncbi:MAG: DUF420 domain-containing protein [Polyangiaceae bacterium]|nr:DUF420 domain-containing protein [Polyangiaceae bacterium]
MSEREESPESPAATGGSEQVLSKSEAERSASEQLNEAGESSKVRLVVTALSAFVFLAVAGVIYLLPSQGQAQGPSALATLNAMLNGSAAICLVLGLTFIKLKKIDWHRRMMLSAFGISSTFLITYLLHHARVGSVHYQGSGLMKTIYLAILIPHIVLALPVVPMALLTIYRGWTSRIEAHRAIAKWTLPIWLYVSVSGVVVYFMLYHYSA